MHIFDMHVKLNYFIGIKYKIIYLRMKMTETFDSMEKVNGMKRVRNNE